MWRSISASGMGECASTNSRPGPGSSCRTPSGAATVAHDLKAGVEDRACTQVRVPPGCRMPRLSQILSGNRSSPQTDSTHGLPGRPDVVGAVMPMKSALVPLGYSGCLPRTCGHARPRTDLVSVISRVYVLDRDAGPSVQASESAGFGGEPADSLLLDGLLGYSPGRLDAHFAWSSGGLTAR
jgi:hypothetical protein